jgi:DNA polymerase-3 subunit delta
MKIRPDQLAADLKQSMHPVYLISGDDVLLCQEAADAIRRHTMSGFAEERLRFVADAQFDWQEVVNELQAMSLFSSRRLFDIQIDKLTEKHSKALSDLPKYLGPDNVVLITLPKVDQRTQKTKWFSTLEQTGAFIQVWPIDPPRMPRWAQQRAQATGLTLTHDSAQLLCERAEGNLLALAQEIDKLALLHPQGTTLQVETIASSVADSSRYTIYDLSNRYLNGKAKDALHCLNQLLGEGTEETILLWLITRDLTTLLELHHEARRSGAKEAFKKARIWDKQIPMYDAALRRLAPPALEYMQRYCAMVDQTIKGLEGPALDIAFRNLILMFCGVKVTATELDVTYL